jgi:hypothetical protein
MEQGQEKGDSPLFQAVSFGFNRYYRMILMTQSIIYSTARHGVFGKYDLRLVNRPGEVTEDGEDDSLFYRLLVGITGWGFPDRLPYPGNRSPQL